MALEKTILNEEVTAHLLSRHYGITLCSMQRLELGSANCYRIYDGNQYYFLKEFQSNFSEDKIVREAMLLEYLTAAGIPTAKFYKTVDGEFVIQFRGHIICLEEYIEGQIYGYDDLPPRLLPAVGAMLGRLHQALKDYPLPDGMAQDWLSSFAPTVMASEYDALIGIAEHSVCDPLSGRIIDDLQYKKQLISRCESYMRYFDGITYCATHGDYQGCQLIFDGDTVKAVIDFSSDARLPVTWELMRSFVQSSNTCMSKVSIDMPAFCDYVREYMNYSPLTRADIVSMPYVYLLQLARSKFGYPQYLKSDSEDRDRLLQFAFWRTQMCREIESKAESISGELLKLLDDMA